MWMRPDSIRARLILGALVWVILATILGGWALSYGFRNAVEHSFELRATALLNTLIGTTEIGADGTPALSRPIGDPQFDRVYSGWYWLVADATGVRLRSRSLWDLELVPERPAANSSPSIRIGRDPLGRELRIFEQTSLLPGTETPITFMLTADEQALEREVAEFNLMLGGALGILGLGLILAVVVQVGFGLRPLKSVAADVGRIREGTAQRLSSTGTRELDVLVDEINTLVEHNRANLQRARGHASDLAHALKTPLAVLQSRLAEQGRTNRVDEEWELVRVMQRIINRQLSRVAAAGPRRGVSTPVRVTVDAVLRGMAKIYADRSLKFRAEMDEASKFAGDEQDLEELLGNLLDNASKWAHSQVLVGVEPGSAADRIVIAVEDDGPGMTETQIVLASERGQRFDSSVPGSGLGLAIVSDLVELYRGRLRLTRSQLGGLRAELELPGN